MENIIGFWRAGLQVEADRILLLHIDRNVNAFASRIIFQFEKVMAIHTNDYNDAQYVI